MIETERFLNGIQSAMGIPKSLVSREFIAYVENFLEEEDVPPSPVRELVEGTIEGIPPAIEVSHPAWKLPMERSLYLFDVLYAIAREKQAV
jgi:hypothetical protein